MIILSFFQLAGPAGRPNAPLHLSAAGLRGQQWGVISRVLSWALIRMFSATLVATAGDRLERRGDARDA